MVFDEHIFVFNRNRLHHCRGHIQRMGNTTFYDSNITHEDRNKYQISFNFKENHGKSLINSEQMVFDDHIFVFNRNRLHHCVVHTQIMGKRIFLLF